jgi:hypothetical protein
MKMLVFPSVQTKVHKDIIFKLIVSRDTKQMRSKNIPRFFLQTRSLEKSRLYFATNGLYTKDKRTKNSYASHSPCGLYSEPSGTADASQLPSNDSINLVFLVF